MTGVGGHSARIPAAGYAVARLTASGRLLPATPSISMTLSNLNSRPGQEASRLSVQGRILCKLPQSLFGPATVAARKQGCMPHRNGGARLRSNLSNPRKYSTALFDWAGVP